MLKDKVKQLCKEHDITMQKLEEILGLGNGAIGKWDKYQPRAENLEKVASYFGVTVDYLLERQKTEKQAPVTNAEKAYDIVSRLPLEMQKAAIAQLRALAELNLRK